MRRVQVKDETHMSASPRQVWRVLTDFPSYPQWWPASVRFVVSRVTPGLIGSRFQVRPYGGRGFSLDAESLVERRELRFRYSGIYRGTGVWTLTEVNGGCRVVYEIDLEIVDPTIKVLSYVLPIARLHSWLMRDVFAGLAAKAASA